MRLQESGWHLFFLLLFFYFIFISIVVLPEMPVLILYVDASFFFLVWPSLDCVLFSRIGAQNFYDSCLCACVREPAALFL